MINMRQLVRRGYNRCANNYGVGRGIFESVGYLDELDKLLKPKSRILDIGCGGGKPVDDYLVGRGHEVTGVDISEKQVALARKNVPGATYLVGDMSQMNFPKLWFDAVVSFYAIFHIPREEHLDLFRMVFGLLKPGGIFLATLGSEDWEGSEGFYGVKMYWSHYGEDKNRELVEEAGFEIIKAKVDRSGGEHHLVVIAQKPR